ncbi:Cochaperone protein [Coniosporium apollinis]|uniref:Cochaperone protein n=1 Tax=Coniosporium apollinis TaxID=61459 RepID=A0ABQ9NKU3_9PEZI|nr:Cochaperone protein [Coniosporium apollinis]
MSEAMDLAARGASALSASNFDEAISQYTKAISLNPKAVDYYIKRSTAYQRASPPDHQAALHDAEIALVLAVKRAKRELIAQAQHRRAIALYHLERYGDAQFVFEIFKKLDPKDKTLPIWEAKLKGKIKELAEDDEKMKVTVKEIPDIELPAPEAARAPATAAATSAEKANGSTAQPPSASASASTPTAAGVVQTPPSKIKHDWYQNNDTVYLSLLAKGVPKDKATINIEERAISISFPTITSDFDFTLDPLFAPINKSASSYNITPHKVELVLKKATPGVKWKSLEAPAAAPDEPASITTPGSASQDKPSLPTRPAAPGAPPAYPTSSRTGPKNWDKLARDLTTAKPTKPSTSSSNPSNAAGTEDEPEDDPSWTQEDDFESGDPAHSFFKQLYANANEDTRRAMMKSYYESNGTALSTDWNEVGKGPVQTTPPEGMVAKKWGE